MPRTRVIAATLCAFALAGGSLLAAAPVLAADDDQLIVVDYDDGSVYSTNPERPDQLVKIADGPAAWHDGVTGGDLDAAGVAHILTDACEIFTLTLDPAHAGNRWGPLTQLTLEDHYRDAHCSGIDISEGVARVAGMAEFMHAPDEWLPAAFLATVNLETGELSESILLASGPVGADLTDTPFLHSAEAIFTLSGVPLPDRTNVFTFTDSGELCLYDPGAPFTPTMPAIAPQVCQVWRAPSGEHAMDVWTADVRDDVIWFSTYGGGDNVLWSVPDVVQRAGEITAAGNPVNVGAMFFAPASMTPLAPTPSASPTASAPPSPSPSASPRPSASPSPTPSPQLGLSSHVARPGDTITVTGTGFPGGETVALELSLPAVLATGIIVAVDGTFSVPVTVPSSAPIAEYDVIALIDGDAIASAALQLVTELPTTGPSAFTDVLSAGGIVLLLLGAVILTLRALSRRPTLSVD